MKKSKSLPKLKKEAQIVFNEYIRKRDENLPCISCDQFKTSYQAGHFYPVGGYDALRFDEMNCHKECVRCNCFDESHLIGYSENLPGRIGDDEFEALKLRANTYKENGYKWNRTELKEIIEKYKDKLKCL